MSKINNVQKSFDKVAATSEVVKQSLEKTAQLQAADIVNKSSKVGATINEVVAGFQAKIAIVDDVIPTVANSYPQSVTTSKYASVVDMQSDVPGLVNKLIREVEGSTDLQKISNNSTLTAAGQLDVVISSTFPEAMAASIKAAVPDVTKAQLQTITQTSVDTSKIQLPPLAELTSVAGPFNETANPLGDLNNALTDLVSSAVTPLKSGITNLKSSVSNLLTNLQNKANKDIGFGFDTLIENAVEDALRPTSNALSKVAKINGIPKQISPADLSSIIHFRTIGDTEQAVKILSKYSDASNEDLLDAVLGIDNSLSKQTNQDAAVFAFNSKNGTTVSNLWNNGAPSPIYWQMSYVDTAQLAAEFTRIKRPVTELIIASTDTGNDIVIEGQRYFDGLKASTNKIAPIHYIIHESGNIQRIVPLEKELTGSSYIPYLLNDHDKNSIVVFLAGGGIGPGLVPDQFGNIYPTTQKQGLHTLLKTAYTHIPGLQVIGAYETGSDGGSPHFDVSQYTKTFFNKVRIDKDLSEGPYTLDEISGTKG